MSHFCLRRGASRNCQALISLGPIVLRSSSIGAYLQVGGVIGGGVRGIGGVYRGNCLNIGLYQRLIFVNVLESSNCRRRRPMRQGKVGLTFIIICVIL